MYHGIHMLMAPSFHTRVHEDTHLKYKIYSYYDISFNFKKLLIKVWWKVK